MMSGDSSDLVNTKGSVLPVCNTLLHEQRKTTQREGD